MTDEQITTAVNAATYGGAGTALAGMAVSDWMAILGFGLALAGFGVNVWHKRKMLRLRREEIELMKGSHDEISL